MAEEIKAPVLEIVVDDGFKKVPIKNLHGDEIGVFYFNPTDVGIISRYNKMAETFDRVMEPLAADVPEGLSEAESVQFTLDSFAEASERLYAACNEVFGGDFAGAFFGKTDPWSPSNGRFYCEVALEMVGKFIENQFDVEVNKLNERVKKYTNRAQRRAARKK